MFLVRLLQGRLEFPSFQQLEPSCCWQKEVTMGIDINYQSLICHFVVGSSVGINKVFSLISYSNKQLCMYDHS